MKVTQIDEPINRQDRYECAIIERLDRLIILFGALALQTQSTEELVSVTEEIVEEVTPKKRITKKK